ncbi:zeta toxin family protein [Streptomyces sp. AN091965]|uniref:zeta toxin family protein n=1 Tax=Streptomyces sp. AN091965 TaxID=2927803 RepID=UPI001F60548F|nr:zeta toxin family protein [Streptomyces sp. AN091965]MCI3933965.1 zeta toxin family protein [Streptomyces sp. AN091965]
MDAPRQAQPGREAPSRPEAPPEVLLLGGRSGAGKSSVGREVAARLRAADVGHALIEGDVLDAVHPAPPDDPDRSRLTTRNLAALWATYAALGCRRLVYTNTASVLGSEEWIFTEALGSPLLTRVLLTATDETAARRLTAREQGSELARQLRRSAYMARHLEAHVPAGTHRVATDGRTVGEVARAVLGATGWLPGTVAVGGDAS